MSLLKSACNVLGENYNVLQKCSSKAQTKIRSIFLILMIPAFIWFVTGYLTASSVFGYGIFASSFTGIIFAAIVLIIDITFLSVKGNWLVFYRFIIVALSCILNTLLFDTIVFGDDFKALENRMHIEELRTTYQTSVRSDSLQLVNLNEQLKLSGANTDMARKDFTSEADGTGGSGVRGMSKIALGKKGVYDQLKQNHDRISYEVNALSGKLREGEERYIEAHKEDRIGIQLRIRAMLEHLFGNGLSINQLFPGICLLLIAMLEFSPLIVKTKMKETDYDVWKENQEKKSQDSMRLELLRLQRMHQRATNYQPADIIALKSLDQIKSNIKSSF
jgi:hypothetical protein